MFTPDETIKALIFDCDGTLFDTLHSHYLSWCAAYDRENKLFVAEQEYQESLSGTYNTEIVKLLNDRHETESDVETIVQHKEKFFLDHYIPSIKPIEKVLKIARFYHTQMPMSVASNGYYPTVKKTLETFEVSHWFLTIVTPDLGLRAKPSPDLFLEAAKRMGVEPEACLVFEDSPTGFEAAERANMQYVNVHEL